VTTVSLENLFEERVFLGLRTVWGADLADISGDLGLPTPPHIAATLDAAATRGLLHRRRERFIPTDQGFLMADSIALDVIDGSTQGL